MADPRDDKVSEAFRALPPLEPPAALDDAIRAAARRAVHAAPERPSRRWAIPASVAAVLALSIGIALHVEREKPLVADGAPVTAGSAEYPVPPSAAPAPAEEKAAAPERAKEAPPEAIRRAEPVAAETRAAPAAPADTGKPAAKAVPIPMPAPLPSPSAVPAPSVPAPAPAMPPAIAPSAPPAPASIAPAGAVAESANAVLQAAPAPAARAADAATPARLKREAPAAAMSLSKEAAPLTPEQRLERIAALRAAGRHAEADEALARFRRELPDYRISPETWDKVKSP